MRSVQNNYLLSRGKLEKIRYISSTLGYKHNLQTFCAYFKLLLISIHFKVV